MKLSDIKPKGLLDLIFGTQTNYVRGIAPLFALGLFLFFFSTFMGYLMGDSIQSSIFEDILKNIPDLRESNNLEVFTAITSNNILAGFIFLVSGLLLGVPPLIFIILNGFFVGWISYSVGAEIGLVMVVATLLPHGIIEIPTIVLCAAMGVGFGYQIINKFRGYSGLQQYIIDSIKVFIFRVIPLLVIAGLIETGIMVIFT